MRRGAPELWVCHLGTLDYRQVLVPLLEVAAVIVVLLLSIRRRAEAV